MPYFLESILTCVLAILAEDKTSIAGVAGPHPPSTSTDTVKEPAVAASSDEKNLNAVDRAISTDSSEDEYQFPTEEESQTLRKVPGNLPLVAFALCLVEFAERASYYGAKTVFSNFVEFPLPKGRHMVATSFILTTCIKLS